MKPLFGVFALFVLAGIVATAPAHAQTAPRPAGNQGIPGQATAMPQMQTQQPAGQTVQSPVPAGSYQTSCTDARTLGGALIAFCQTGGGTWRTTGIAEADQCRGDISNIGGNLNCNRATTTAAASPASIGKTPPAGRASNAANTAYPPPAYGSTTQPGYPPPSSGGITKPAYPR